MAQRILFVDDEHDIVECARAYFEAAGYEFVGAFDGLQALQAVSEHKPDLVVLDINMPRLNGWDTLKILQEDDATVDLPVLLLTANTQDRDKAKGWELGCTWYHTKPFDFDDLLMVISRILGGNA